MRETNIMTSLTVGVVFAVFAVWMQRHQRWGYFVNGLTGRYVITGSRAAGSGSSGTGSLVPGSTYPGATGPATPQNPYGTYKGLPIRPFPGSPSGIMGGPGSVKT